MADDNQTEAKPTDITMANAILSDLTTQCPQAIHDLPTSPHGPSVILVRADDQDRSDQPQRVTSLPVFFGLKPLLHHQGLEEDAVHELEGVRYTWLHAHPLFTIILYV